MRTKTVFLMLCALVLAVITLLTGCQGLDAEACYITPDGRVCVGTKDKAVKIRAEYDGKATVTLKK